ncbi:hypothetical protein [Desulfobulbus sp.]|uniref:hypothetical protein n=1 Tax=Desulfobulbus sp. TaxID=895 RepID=UPI0027B9D844|nr:hypothetical protein [Desulfobulbus sp.]
MIEPEDSNAATDFPCHNCGKLGMIRDFKKGEKGKISKYRCFGCMREIETNFLGEAIHRDRFYLPGYGNIIKEHKFLIIFICFFIVSKIIHPMKLQWYLVIPGVISGLIAIYELADSRFGILKYIGWAIIIYFSVWWVLGGGSRGF